MLLPLATLLSCIVVSLFPYVESCVTGIAIPNINVPGGAQAAASSSVDTSVQESAKKIVETLQQIPTGNYLNMADNMVLPFINKALTSVFQGNQHAEIFVSGTQGPIACASDLNCNFSSPCRWRNGENGYLRWYKATGEAKNDTWTSFTSLKTQPVSPYLLFAGQDTPYQAIFISDSIPSQPGDGLITFKFWETPLVGMKVCIRAPGKEQMLGCTKDMGQNGVSAERNVTIKGPINTEFEIVFVGGPFRVKPGGMLFLDDITYSSDVCKKEKLSTGGTTSDTITTGVNADAVTKGNSGENGTTVAQTTAATTVGQTSVSPAATVGSSVAVTTAKPAEGTKDKLKESETKDKSKSDRTSSKESKKKLDDQKEGNAEEIITLNFLNKNLQGAFGGTMKANHYYTADQTGEISSPKELSCTFDTPCRWRTVKDPMDLNFYSCTGQPDQQRFQSIVGTKIQPKSPYGLTAGLTDAKGAWFVSDPIRRRSPTTTLKFKYWLTPMVQLKVCMSKDKLRSFFFCSDALTASDSNGQAEKVMQLSGVVDDVFQIVFQFSNFVFFQGGTGMLDDISYEDPLSR